MNSLIVRRVIGVFVHARESGCLDKQHAEFANT
jgi:hypothetical protein